MMDKQVHQFWPNGYLIVGPNSGKDEGPYAGVYGDVWPWKYFDPDKPYETGLGIPLEFSNAVQVATNWQPVYEGWHECIELCLQARLLFIETELAFPVVEPPLPTDWEFVGYDIACPTGSFFSAIQQELLFSGRTLLREWKRALNHNDLFDDPDTARAYQKERERLYHIDPAIEFTGDFYVIRVSRFTGMR